MNCKKCNQPLNDNELFCKNCGYQGPLNEQKEKVALMKEKINGTIVTKTHSTIFLIVCICFTIMTLCQLGSVFSNFTNLLETIFMIIGTVGLWKSYAAKENAKLAKSLKSASIYDQFLNVMYSISMVLLILAMVAVMIGIAIIAIGTQAETADIIKPILIVAGIFLVIIIIVCLFQKIYVNRRAYFKSLAECAATGDYKAEKAPIFGSIVIGGSSFLGGIFSIFFSSLASVIISALLGMVGDSIGSDMAEIEGMITPILTALTSGAVVTGLADLAFGGYYVLSAIWMRQTHNEMLALRDEVKVEAEKLETLEADTQYAFTAYQNEKDLAAKKEQEQQNKMMQMMMQQMMANGTLNNTAPAAEAAKEEAPAESN